MVFIFVVGICCYQIVMKNNSVAFMPRSEVLLGLMILYYSASWVSPQ
ncbi:hypothetical protein [Psychromonas sp. CNPT3]|nr:hypothetical protein [Psychromonas sp. CNPT3]